MSSFIMSRHRRHVTAGAAVGCSLALVLTACSGSTGSKASGDNASCDGVNVLMHSQPPMQKGLETVAAAFEAANKGAKIKFTFVPSENFANVRNARLTAGGLDITEGNSSGATRATPSYVKGIPASDWVRGLDAGLWTELHGKGLENFSPGVRKALQYKGKDYSVPTGISYVTGLYYNQDMFNKLGIKLPTTFDELVAAAEKLKGAGITPLMMGGAEKWPVGLLMEGVASSSIPDMAAFDKGLWTGKTAFTDPDAVEVLKKVKTLYSYAEPTFPGISAATVTGSFVAGKAAMIPDGSWGADGISLLKPKFKWGYFPLPGSDNPKNNAILRGKLETNMAIPANAKHKACAARFLEFYSQPANYQAFIAEAGFLPAMADVKSTQFLQSIAHYSAKEGFAPTWEGVFSPNPAAGKDARVGFPYDKIAPMGNQSDMEALAKSTQTAWAAALPK